MRVNDIFQKACLNKFFKLSIILSDRKGTRLWNYNDYLMGVKSSKRKLTGLVNIQRNLLLMVKMLTVIKRIVFNGGVMLFADINPETSNIISKKVMKANHFCISKPLNVSGSLTNFGNMR